MLNNVGQCEYTHRHHCLAVYNCVHSNSDFQIGFRWCMSSTFIRAFVSDYSSASLTKISPYFIQVFLAYLFLTESFILSSERCEARRHPI
jgi:hypothetical protein